MRLEKRSLEWFVSIICVLALHTYSFAVEIDNNGGHILAPSDWSHAEFTKQTDVAGACKQKGLFHIFIR